MGWPTLSDSLVHRYEMGRGAGDGLTGSEGTFNMCTFWLVEALTRAGRLEEARFVFEKMLTYGNHLGLYAEEIGPSGEALGNFPQAFTHMGLISETLQSEGAAVIAPSANGRWRTYAASNEGVKHGVMILDRMDEEGRKYVKNVVQWVLAQSFGSLVKSIYAAYPEMKENSIFQG